MARSALQSEDIAEILHDADCPEEFTRQFLTLMRGGSTGEQIRLLRAQRCRQLERVHAEEKKLDLLDYLGYQLEKQEKQAAAARV